tara:strand:+ start:9378 stop:9488 length:111 start_codon:yes stop_codon:yes gene_type:complete
MLFLPAYLFIVAIMVNGDVQKITAGQDAKEHMIHQI